jgi:hypothetical protein
VLPDRHQKGRNQTDTTYNRSTRPAKAPKPPRRSPDGLVDPGADLADVDATQVEVDSDRQVDERFL